MGLTLVHGSDWSRSLQELVCSPCVAPESPESSAKRRIYEINWCTAAVPSLVLKLTGAC